jgi:hypothetical protein
LSTQAKGGLEWATGRWGGETGMSYSEKTVKMLWGRAANRCAICRIELVMDRSRSDDESVVGDTAHIVARDEDGETGPRSVACLSLEEQDRYANLISNRNKYVNLLVLCKNHHKQVDDQPSAFPVAKLLEIKESHEAWVRESLDTFDPEKQRDDELYADYVDRWAELVNLRDWIRWTGGIFYSGQPGISKEMDANLEKARTWLLNRIWPRRYPALEHALMEFREVLEDFHMLFREHAEQWGDDKLITEKFYKRAYERPDFDLDYLHCLERKYDYHVYLVEDLALELTRAANRVCDEVRKSLDPTFMLEEGRLMIQEGPGMDLKWTKYVVEYGPDEKYSGLGNFKEKRKTRVRHFADEGEKPPEAYNPVDKGQ